MGFNVVALTYYPSDIIVPKRTRGIIQNVITKLSIPHEYISGDISAIGEGALEGRYHPCGRCHKHMEEVIIEATKKRGISAIALGDLLPTGAGNIHQNRMIRINPFTIGLKRGHEILSWKDIRL